MAATTFCRPGPEDLGAIARLLHHAFSSPIEGAAKWLNDAGLGNVRAMRPRDGSAPEASLVRVPMGQYFGGRAVSMLGIAGVAVAPEARGRGLAREMMRQAVHEAAADGFALTGLYASTQALYRSVGYEQSGYRFRTSIPLHRIDARAREPVVRPLGDSDEPAVRECYARFAERFNGMLDRGGYCWARTRVLREQTFVGFGIDAPGAGGRRGLDGYVFFSQARPPGSMHGELTVSDIAFATPSAGERLLGFMADFATTTDHAVLFGGPLHPLVSLMDAHQYGVEKGEYWMLRITDPAKALESRGYARNISAALRLDIHDPILSRNTGSWTLSVEHGRGSVRKESDARPAVECDVRALGPIYSGLYTARQAETLGWVRGDAGAIAAADSIFGGFGTPWMSDFF